jgi:Zinc finger, C3HC4 type (RING finger)
MEQECCICYEKEEIIVLRCCHFVCSFCLKKIQKPMCPLCRTVINDVSENQDEIEKNEFKSSTILTRTTSTGKLVYQLPAGAFLNYGSNSGTVYLKRSRNINAEWELSETDNTSEEVASRPSYWNMIGTDRA